MKGKNMNVGISQEEKDLISQIKQMGSENEDSDKLLAFCQKAYRSYREGKISANTYEKIYVIAKSYMRTRIE